MEKRRPGRAYSMYRKRPNRIGSVPPRARLATTEWASAGGGTPFYSEGDSHQGSVFNDPVSLHFACVGHDMNTRDLSDCSGCFPNCASNCFVPPLGRTSYKFDDFLDWHYSRSPRNSSVIYGLQRDHQVTQGLVQESSGGLPYSDGVLTVFHMLRAELNRCIVSARLVLGRQRRRVGSVQPYSF